MGMDETMKAAQAGMVDFSWIGKGFKDGTEFALKRMEIDAHIEAAKIKAEEVRAQREMANVQKGMQVFDAFQKAMAETSMPVRKVGLKTAMNLAKFHGIPVDEMVIAAAIDPESEPMMQKAMANIASGMGTPEDFAVMFRNGITMQSLRDAAELNTKVRDLNVKEEQGERKLDQGDTKLGIDQQKADETERHNRATEILAQKKLELQKKLKAGGGGADGKFVERLRKEAQTIEKAFEQIDEVDNVIASLQRGTPADDQLAITKFQRISGDDRISNYDKEGMIGLGDILMRTRTFVQKNFVSGELLAPEVRKQMIAALGSVASAKNRIKMDRMGPIFEELDAKGIKDTAARRVFTARTMAQFGLDPTKNAAQKSIKAAIEKKKAAAPAAPKSTLSDRDRGIVLNFIGRGATFAQVQAAFKKLNKPAPTPAEFKALVDQAKGKK